MPLPLVFVVSDDPNVLVLLLGFYSDHRNSIFLKASETEHYWHTTFDTMWERSVCTSLMRAFAVAWSRSERLMIWDMNCSSQKGATLLPSRQGALYQHTKRANYQTTIWRSLQNTPDVPEPTNEHGWILSRREITMLWWSIQPTPEVVFSIIVWRYQRYCKEGTCICLGNGMRCTPACNLQNCTNEDDDDDITNDIGDGDDDEEVWVAQSKKVVF